MNSRIHVLYITKFCIMVELLAQALDMLDELDSVSPKNKSVALDAIALILNNAYEYFTIHTSNEHLLHNVYYASSNVRRFAFEIVYDYPDNVIFNTNQEYFKETIIDCIEYVNSNLML